MAGKKKVVDRSRTWCLTVETDADRTFYINIMGGSDPLQTIMDMDAVDRKYLARMLNGETPTSVKWDNVD